MAIASRYRDDVGRRCGHGPHAVVARSPMRYRAIRQQRHRIEMTRRDLAHVAEPSGHVALALLIVAPAGDSAVGFHRDIVPAARRHLGDVESYDGHNRLPKVGITGLARSACAPCGPVSDGG